MCLPRRVIRVLPEDHRLHRGQWRQGKGGQPLGGGREDVVARSRLGTQKLAQALGLRGNEGGSKRVAPAFGPALGPAFGNAFISDHQILGIDIRLFRGLPYGPGCA